MQIARIAALVLAAAAAAAVAPAAQSAYTVTNLGAVGPYNGWVYSRAWDVNAGGVVVGESTVSSSPYHAFRYGNGKIVDLGTLGAPPWEHSFAHGVNVQGDVVGWTHVAASQTIDHAFLWSGGMMTDLGTLGGYHSYAYAINESREVVGYSDTAGNAARRGVLWSGGGMLALPTLGGVSSWAYDINERHQIVGEAQTDTGAKHAFLYAGGMMTDLGTLPKGNESRAEAINDRGRVVGFAKDYQGYYRAFDWDAATGLHDMGTLPGHLVSAAYDVSSYGQVVGFSRAGINSFAVMWPAGGGPAVDLNTLLPPSSGWTLAVADAINARGQIVGVGWFKSMAFAFLLTDAAAPTVSCASPDGLWHADDVAIACTADDPESGLTDPADAFFTLSTNVQQGTETAQAATGSRWIYDHGGNLAAIGPIYGNKVDKKAPQVTIKYPFKGQTYVVGEQDAASYGCADGGSGVATCDGPVPNGDPVDTSFVGSKTFAVNAVDDVGNPAPGPLSTVAYDVAYGIELLYDPAKPLTSGAIGLRLVDAGGANLSDPAVGVTVVGIDKPSGLADPFIYVKGDYTYTLPKGVGSGAHTLYFEAAGDPTLHSAQFVVP